MKKQIQSPAGFRTVDSFIEPQYFNDEELPPPEQIIIRAAYTAALNDLKIIIASNQTPTIDSLPKAQVAIRELIGALVKLAVIQKKELEYHKKQMDV